MAARKSLSALCADISACRHCEQAGLIPSARPIFQLGACAPIGIFGQAPGNLAHQSGRPFSDPSGDRLRQWLGVDEDQFYDPDCFAIAPMAFCFPGYDGSGPTGKGGDRPPPKVCAERWRTSLMDHLNGQLKLALLIGNYAQAWHLGSARKKTLTETVRAWKTYPTDKGTGARLFVLPHPSWRNSGWLKRNPWFESELLPELQAEVQKALTGKRSPA